MTSTATMEDIIIDQVREIVEGFGEALKQVSVQSPDVTEEILQVYAQFVSPELIDQWLSDPALAPGRVGSSPWPERIEIQSISEISSTKYSVAGRLNELTSQELVTGGSVNEIPVRIMVENKRGNWMITEYSQDSFQP